MKLISLNTWGGKLYKPLINFIKENSSGTDIFCFQEVFKTTSDVEVLYERRMNLFEDISQILVNHKGYYSPCLKDYVIFSRTENHKVNFNLNFGLAIFIKKNITIDSTG